MLLTRKQIKEFIRKLGQPQASVFLNRFFNSYRSKLNSNDVKYLYDSAYFQRVHSHPTTILVKNKYKINTHNRFTYEYLQPKINAGTRILDIGCGNGEFVLALASHNIEFAMGIDFSEDVIIDAQKKLEGNHLPCQFLQCDASTFKFETPFDFITLNDVFEHLSDTELTQLLNNLKHCLKEDGEIILHTPNGLALCHDTVQTLPLTLYKIYYRLFKNWRGHQRTPDQLYYDQVHINIKSYAEAKSLMSLLGFKVRVKFDHKSRWFFLNRFSTHMLIFAKK
jgi:2-polyprenyl-3-methyl-5-hydroxy-6-metoxy-1,4-benzoquinol methylase